MNDLRIDAQALQATSPAAQESKPAPGSGGFAQGLENLIKATDAQQKEAEAHVRARALGEGNLVETMVAMSKADLATRMVVSVRNRALEAYQEIMRMPV